MKSCQSDVLGPQEVIGSIPIGCILKTPEARLGFLCVVPVSFMEIGMFGRINLLGH